MHINKCTKLIFNTCPGASASGFLIADGLIARYGEAFFKLTSKGARAAKRGMRFYKRRELFWSLVDDVNKITPVIKAAYAVAGAIFGWLASLLFG